MNEEGGKDGDEEEMKKMEKEDEEDEKMRWMVNERTNDEQTKQKKKGEAKNG